jgi:hypothetical protein
MTMGVSTGGTAGPGVTKMGIDSELMYAALDEMQRFRELQYLLLLEALPLKAEAVMT